MGWHPWWVTWTRIRVIGVNFYQVKRNLVRVSGEFELSEFELTELKWLKSGVKSKGDGTWVELAGEFEFSEFELPGLYCSYNFSPTLTRISLAMKRVCFSRPFHRPWHYWRMSSALWFTNFSDLQIHRALLRLNRFVDWHWFSDHILTFVNAEAYQQASCYPTHFHHLIKPGLTSFPQLLLF